MLAPLAPRPDLLAAILCVVLGSAACGARFGYDETVQSCAALGDCPLGTTCLAQVCTEDLGDTETPDADPAAPDAGSGSGDVAPCGSMSLLRDGFDGPVISPAWGASAQTGVSLVQTAGHLAIALGVGTAAVEGRYDSRHAYDLRGSGLVVTVLRTAGEYVAIEVRDPEGRGGAMAVESGLLVAIVLDRTVETRRAQIAYDPVRHRHWRLHEASGALDWETSADGATWVDVHSEPLPMTGTLAHAGLVARGQTAAGGETWFDEVNLPAPSVPGFCAASGVRDSFDDGTVAASYNNWSRSSCVGVETDGVLELGFSGVGDSWCGTETRQLVDLRDDAAFVEVLAAPSAATAMAFFEAVTLSGDKIQIGRGPDGLFAEMRQAGRQVAWQAIPYDPAVHRFWRLRESSGRTFWDTSRDGVSWTSAFSAPTAIDLSAVIIDMAAGHWSPGPGAPFVVRYDRLNVAP